MPDLKTTSQSEPIAFFILVSSVIGVLLVLLTVVYIVYPKLPENL